MKERPSNAGVKFTTVIITFFSLLLPAIALAADDKLPYEGGLKMLYDSLTGTVPFAISLVGIVACGAMLIFGGEISGFMRTLVFIVLVISVIVQAAGLIELIGGKKNPFAYDESHPGSVIELTRQVA